MGAPPSHFRHGDRPLAGSSLFAISRSAKSHWSSDSDCNPSRNSARISLLGFHQMEIWFLLIHKETTKSLRNQCWNSRSGNPKRLPVSSRSAPSQTSRSVPVRPPGQLPVSCSSRSAPGQLPVSSQSAPSQLPVSPSTPSHGIRARNPSKTWYGGIGEALIMKDCDVLL